MPRKFVLAVVLLVTVLSVLSIPAPAAADAPCRFGIAAPLDASGLTAEMQALGICDFLNWSAVRPAYLPPSIGFVHVLRVGDAQIGNTLSQLAGWVASDPGGMWVVGNEPDTCYEGQDCVEAAIYAQRYYAIASAIRAQDSSAQIGFGPIVQPTPIRLRYLDDAWAELINQAGSSALASGLIDVWTIHAFILNEWPGEWGTGVPPGFESDYVDAIRITNLDDTHNNAIFRSRVQDFRQWMAAKGEQTKPLWITEYGSLFPPIDPVFGDYVNVPDSETARFMRRTFDDLLSMQDPATGLAADGNRLVQRWFWYSLNGHRYQFGGSLFDPDSGDQRTNVGFAFDDYQQQLAGTADAAGTALTILRAPNEIHMDQMGVQWFARLAPTQTGRRAARFRFVVWVQLPDEWRLPWAAQYSFKGDFANTNMVRDFTSLWWVKDSGHCPQGGPAPAGTKWRAWFGPEESYPHWARRVINQVNLRGGLFVPTGSSPGEYSLRVVVGAYYDSDGDSSLDRYVCMNAGQTEVIVP